MNDRSRTALRCGFPPRRQIRMGSSFRWNDGERCSPERECPKVAGVDAASTGMTMGARRQLTISCAASAAHDLNETG
ncbi:hypothetical protein ACFW0P_15495 [Lysobacter soli]|uniref:hypothetical protein n=1 Tax=Lysobacter soli TaxID=453783 RepID=UPI00368123BE